MFCSAAPNMITKLSIFVCNFYHLFGENKREASKFWMIHHMLTNHPHLDDLSCYKYHSFWSSTSPETGLVTNLQSIRCLQYEFCTASNEHCKDLGMRLTWDRQTMNTWILEDGWLVRAVCRTMMGSRGMARCVKMKQRRLGPTRCLRSFQWRRGWTASYWLIWRGGRNFPS